jgi:hypothetical protein
MIEGLQPPFEEEFPDKKHPERNEVDVEYESGQVNATQAGYIDDGSEPLPKNADIVDDEQLVARAVKAKKRKRNSQPRLTGRLATHADASQFQADIIYNGNHK